MSFISRFRAEAPSPSRWRRSPRWRCSRSARRRTRSDLVPGCARRARRRSHRDPDDLVQGADRGRNRPARLPVDRAARNTCGPTSRRSGTIARSARLAQRLLREGRQTAPTMLEVAKADRSEAERAVDDDRPARRGVENGWRELMLSDIGREKMEHVRTPVEQLIDARDNQGRERIARTSTRRCWLNRLGVTTMTAVSLLALFMYLRQTAALDRTLADEAGPRRRRAESPRGPRSRRAPGSFASSPSICQRSARTSAAASHASSTTSSAPCSPPRSSTSPASSRASARRSPPTRPSGWPISTNP